MEVNCLDSLYFKRYGFYQIGSNYTFAYSKINILIKLFFFLKDIMPMGMGRGRRREVAGERENRTSIFWFTPQTVAVDRAEWQGSKYLDHVLLFPRCSNRDLFRISGAARTQTTATTWEVDVTDGKLAYAATTPPQ